MGQNQGFGRAALLGPDRGTGVKVVEISSPEGLGFLGVPLWAFPDHRPEPVPARVDRQGLGGPGETLDQVLTLAKSQPGRLPDDEGIEGLGEPNGQGWVDPSECEPDRTKLADRLGPEVLGQQLAQLPERADNWLAERPTLQNFELRESTPRLEWRAGSPWSTSG